MKKLALLGLIISVVLVSSAVGQEFTDVTVGSADPGATVVTEGVYEVTGNGADVWGTADAFQYYYTELIGDGSMVARVVDMGEGSNAWAKGGVMIRQSLDAGSMHAITALTGSEGGGAAFQRRIDTDGESTSNHSLADGPYAPPYWVKTERVGNDFTGYISADGETWVQAGDTVTIEMADPVLIGLAVTSHAAGELRTVTFDNVAVESVLANSLVVWEDAATAAAPGFLATNVEDGVYDIGTYGGEMTYEFIVQSNPDEEEASMALIGRRNFGDPQAGLKYEQWNNTGTYGATIFGVADYDYGVATDPGVITHLVFVASTEAGMTDLYVNGAYKGSVEAAITLSGLVGIGYGAQAEDGSDFFDDFDGAIYGVAIYDGALSLAQIRVNADTFLQKGPSDITAAGDLVQGVPNDGDWPGAETPDLAIDDNAETKYLHFKGETEPTGFQVTPVLGSTLVTGLTLTTANDAIERDPILFELYGSNESIDGPYELIAAGEVADFNDVDAWPRFTMNATPITFENEVAYDHYQVMFPAVRDPASANSMQIAEVELIGVPVLPKPVVAWVSYHAADDEPHADAAAVGFTQAPDIGYTDLLKANGYDVVRVLTSQEPDVEYLSTFDLVIISRTASSGHYSGSGASLWNSITAPMINLNGYTLRNSRLGFTDGGTMVDTIGDIALTVTDAAHPIFAGIELGEDGTMVNPFADGAVPLPTDETIISRGISVNNNILDEEGTLLATVATADDPTVGGLVIAELPAGATLQNSSGSPDDVLGGPRLVFLTGSREPDGVTGGQAAALYDLYADGELMFLNAVDYMIQ